jgi:hypothetical protein
MDRVLGNMDEFIKYINDNVNRYLDENEVAQVSLVNKNQHTYHGFVIADKSAKSATPSLPIESVLDYYDFTNYEEALENIPDSVVMIENEAFAGCEHLRTVDVSGNTAINESAFKDCDDVEIMIRNNAVSEQSVPLMRRRSR